MDENGIDDGKRIITAQVIEGAYVESKHKSYIWDCNTLCTKCNCEFVCKLGGRRFVCMNCGFVFFERWPMEEERLK